MDMEPKDKIESVDEWLNLPEPSFPSLMNNKENGTVYTVQKVGFLAVPETDCRKNNICAQSGPGGKSLLPTAVVEFAGQQQLCRLPLELTSWVFDCVAMAHSGMNSFPSKVEFGVLDGRTYAELL